MMAGCGGGGGGGGETTAAPAASSAPAPQFAVGGTVTGLEPGASLTLTNGTEKLTVAANGSFVFPTRLSAGSGFNISASAPDGYSCKLSDAAGNIGKADSTNTTVACTTVLLAGAIGQLQNALAVTADRAGNVYVVDGARYAVVKFSPDGRMSTLAGGSDKPGWVDGPGKDARFRFGRAAIATDAAGNLIVTDACNGMLRKITPDGVVSTLAGHGTSACNNVETQSTTDDIKDGVGAAAALAMPDKLVADGAGGWIVTEMVTDGTVRKVSASGAVTTEYLELEGWRVAFRAAARAPDGSLYLADAGRIYKYTNGSLSEFVGTIRPGQYDGARYLAAFASIRDMVAAPNGDLYVADGSKIRKVTPDGVVTTLAGAAGGGAVRDGQGDSARFTSPVSIALDGTGLIVLDGTPGLLRRVAFDGTVTTMAAPAATRGSVDGTGSAARLADVGSLAADAEGNLYFADSLAHVLRKATPDGKVSTIAGRSGVAGFADGPLATATFNVPRAVAAGRDGSLWVAQATGLRRIQNGEVTTVNASIQATAITIDADGNAILANDHKPQDLIRMTPQGEKTVLASAHQMAALTSRPDNWFIPASVAIDSAGNIFAADAASVAVYKLGKSGELSLFAGTPLKEKGDVDGAPGTATLGFHEFGQMTIDDKDNLYLSGQGGVRKISPAGIVSSPGYAWGKTPIVGVAYAKGKLYGMARYALLQSWLP
jgi:hypothetical protein